MAARLNTLQLLHWPRRSPCSNRCTRGTDQHAPTAALAIPFSMFPSAALAPHITMRRAPHLPRMSRIAAVLLPLHTASALPLGTRLASVHGVAVAAPVWMSRPPRHPPPESQCVLFGFEAPLRERRIESTSGQPHPAEQTASRADSVGERSSNTIGFGRCLTVTGGCSTCPLTHDKTHM